MPYSCKTQPYEGEGQYIFVSYAHKDADEVFPILDELTERGYRIWYDDGIVPGSEWPEYIAEHLLQSRMVISFVTPNFVKSTNCKRELTYAQSEEKTVLAVVLRETDMPKGVKLQLSAQQNIYKANYNEEKFLRTICAANGMADCKGEEIQRPVVQSKSGTDVHKKLKHKPVIIGISVSVILILSLIFYFFAMKDNPDTYSTDVAKAVDDVCSVAVGLVDNSGTAVLRAIDFCRDFINGDIDEEALSVSCESLKESIRSYYSNYNISSAVLERTKDITFCNEALETAEECSIFEQYIDFAQNVALKSSITQKSEIFNQLEIIVEQKFLIVLDEAFGAIRPIINDSDSEYSSQLLEYVHRTNTLSELSDMINDSLFGDVYVLENRDASDPTIYSKINTCESAIKNCNDSIFQIAGSLWTEICG